MTDRKSFVKCPEGHDLPRRLESGRACTPVMCAGEEDKAVAKVQENRKAAKEQTALARLEQRRALIPQPPEGMTPAEAEAYVSAKKIELGPKAIAELEYQLKYGTDEQRMKAAERALDMAGHGKKEGNFGSAAVIIVTGVDATKLPWGPTVTVDEKK